MRSSGHDAVYYRTPIKGCGCGQCEYSARVLDNLALHVAIRGWIWLDAKQRPLPQATLDDLTMDEWTHASARARRASRSR